MFNKNVNEMKMFIMKSEKKKCLRDCYTYFIMSQIIISRFSGFYMILSGAMEGGQGQ